MLHVRNISKRYGDKEVLRDVSSVVNAGERLAVLGPNGAGKSTLLRVIAGIEHQEAGNVVLTPPSLRVAYLPQGYTDQPDLRVEAAVPTLARKRTLEREVGRLAEQIAGGDAPARLAERYETALEELERVADDAGSSAEPLLQAWGLADIDRNRPVSSLSGGEQTRLGLARLLAQRPDVVLLDEPTNHLDLEGIEALEAWLAGFGGALVLVTHDRALLARVPTSLLELSPHDGGWRAFSGSYAELQETKERELEQQWAAHGQQQRRDRRVRDQIRRLKQWASRIEGETINFHYLKRAARIARQATVVDRRLQRSLESDDRVGRPERKLRLRPELASSVRSGDDALSVEGLRLDVEGRTLLRDVDFGLRYGERVALLGPNGSGKTTLLRAIAGELASAGGRVRIGAGTRVALLSQDQEGLDPALTPVETLRPHARMDEGTLRRFLHHYLLTDADVRTPAGRLSFGQRARLGLAKLALQGVNLLLLDEPTNHLDIESREAFEQVLDAFDGTVLVVTHDRYFVEVFASHVLRLEDGRVREYPTGA